LVLVWGALWFAFYPGLVSIDTAVQWTQIDTGKINDHHPAFHTLMLMLIRKVWDSPAAVVLLQILVLGALVSYGFVLLLRAGVSRWVVAVAYPISLVFPQLGQMAIGVLKDTPYSLVLFGLTLALAHPLLGKHRPGGRRFWCAIGALLALATLFRHNGIVVTVGMAALLPVFFWQERRVAWLAALSAALVLLVVKGGVYRLFDVEGRVFTHRATTFAWDIGALVDQDVPFNPDEYGFLDKMRELDEQRWMYSPNSVALLIWGSPDDTFDFQWADSHLGELTRLHTSLLARYPLHFVRHVLRSDAYLYSPLRIWDTTEINDVTYFLDEGSPPLARMKAIGHPMKPLFPRAKRLLSRLIRPSLLGDVALGGLLWRPALWMYLGLLGVAAAVWRTCNPRLWVLAAPMMLNTISLTLGVAQEARFQFPVFISVGFLACLAALPRRPAPARSEGS
jgi:hypothetical protein